MQRPSARRAGSATEDMQRRQHDGKTATTTDPRQQHDRSFGRNREQQEMKRRQHDAQVQQFSKQECRAVQHEAKAKQLQLPARPATEGAQTEQEQLRNHTTRQFSNKRRCQRTARMRPETQLELHNSADRKI